MKVVVNKNNVCEEFLVIWLDVYDITLSKKLKCKLNVELYFSYVFKMFRNYF